MKPRPTPEERAVSRAAARCARARADLEAEMQNARYAGISTYRIGAAAGLSAEHVRRLTTSEPQPTVEALGIDTTIVVRAGDDRIRRAIRLWSCRRGAA